MKQFVVLICCAALILSLAGCGADPTPPEVAINGVGVWPGSTTTAKFLNSGLTLCELPEAIPDTIPPGTRSAFTYRIGSGKAYSLHVLLANPGDTPAAPEACVVYRLDYRRLDDGWAYSFSIAGLDGKTSKRAAIQEALEGAPEELEDGTLVYTYRSRQYQFFFDGEDLLERLTISIIE